MGPHATHRCKDCLSGRIMSGSGIGSGRSSSSSGFPVFPDDMLLNGGSGGPDGPGAPSGPSGPTREVPCEYEGSEAGPRLGSALLQPSDTCGFVE